MKAYIMALALVLNACSSITDDREIVASDDENIFVDAISGTFEGVVDTIQTPFKDLGFTKEEIPKNLADAATGPYSPPARKKCKAILEEIAALNEVLGEDKYDPNSSAKNDKEESYLAEGVGLASGMAVSKVGKFATIPFRGVVRKVSGAAKHEKASRKAYDAGEIRRAYLRGMADSPSLNCYKQKKKPAKVKEATKVGVST